MLSLAAFRVELGSTYLFATFLSAVFNERKKGLLHWRALLNFFLCALALGSSNLLLISVAFCGTILLTLPFYALKAKSQEWLFLLLYLLPIFICLTAALILYYSDCGDFCLHSDKRVHSATLDLFCVVALLRIGVFPFHGYILRKIRRQGQSALWDLLHPLTIFLPLCIAGSAEIIPSSSEDRLLLLQTGIVMSLYFALASFRAKDFYQYFFYIFSSVAIIAVASLPDMGAEVVGATVYFFCSMVVSLCGALICLDFFSRRYGIQRVEKMMGLLQVNRGVGLLFLFFAFTLANMPLALSFLGEDLMLNRIYILDQASGVGAIVSFSIIAISLYRFYLDVFGGVKANFPIFPPLPHERRIFAILLMTGIALPFLPLFYG
jgi:hypothetical protein